MSPNEKGRYCNSCAKTVVDFSVMTDEEVQHYFTKYQEPVCGRFKVTQLHRITIDLPSNILHISMPLWKKFLVASLLIFGTTVFPFDTTIAQDSTVDIHPDLPAIALIDTPKQQEPLKIDTIDLEIKYLPEEITTSTIECPAMLTGFSVMEPIPAQEVIITQMILGDIAISESKSPDLFLVPAESNDLPGTVSAGNTPNSKEPAKQPDTPYIPSEFILPSLLIIKRKKRRTMD